ncbi:MAG TPA: Fis family transcriptional regulator [Myxococcaceae bacterium]|nr:Fis family transcriptional regulator [Myxococcaceae bacterium]
METGYTEAELVENRVPVLLFGGAAAERQAWAEETALRRETAMTVVSTAEELPPALARKEGVVFVADLLALGEAGQVQVLRCLQFQEERPKLVLGLPLAADAALGTGELRADLHYRLRRAQVNLDAPGLRETIARRRARGPGRPQPAASPGPRRRPARAKRHPAPKKGRKGRRAAASRRRR